MRIAFISSMSAAPWGGSEVLWSRTAAEALRHGHAVFASVATWPTLPAPLAELQQAGAVLHQRAGYSPQLSVRLARRVGRALGQKTLEQRLAEFDPDVICLSQGGNFDIANMPELRRFLLESGIPYCLVCHNYDASKLPPAPERQAAAAAYAGACRVYFVSADQAQVSQRQLARSFPTIELVKNPINIAQPEQLPWPAQDIAQLAVVGGLHIDFKGQDILLEVLSSATWRARSWHLNIYGQGYDEAYIRELLTLYQLESRVTLHGYTNDIAQLWRHNHLLLLPSRREAAPLVIMEAMLCGRPVVATAVGTVPEWVQPGQTGFVAAAATVPAFGNALEEAWARRAEWVTLGQQAHQWASQAVDLNAAANFLQCLVSCAQAA